MSDVKCKSSICSRDKENNGHLTLGSLWCLLAAPALKGRSCPSPRRGELVPAQPLNSCRPGRGLSRQELVAWAPFAVNSASCLFKSQGLKIKYSWKNMASCFFFFFANLWCFRPQIFLGQGQSMLTALVGLKMKLLMLNFLWTWFDLRLIFKTYLAWKF